MTTLTRHQRRALAAAQRAMQAAPPTGDLAGLYTSIIATERHRAEAAMAKAEAKRARKAERRAP